MTTQNLQDKGGFGEDSGTEAKWQKHVIVALWVLFALLVVVTATLMFAEAHGFFEPSSGHSPPVAPWPDSLQ
jgi:hypothetical protein